MYVPLSSTKQTIGKLKVIKIDGRRYLQLDGCKCENELNSIWLKGKGNGSIELVKKSR